MEAVAQALSQAERDEQASHAARATTGVAREDAMMYNGQNEQLIGDARNFYKKI